MRAASALAIALLALMMSAANGWGQEPKGLRAASAEEWRVTVAAALKEGKVILYASPPPPLLARLKADFENAAPGIVLEFSRVTDGVLISRLDQERKAGSESADAVITTELRWLEERAKAGSIKPGIGPESAGWPRKYIVAAGVPVIGLDPFVIVYNTMLVKTPITGYKDLLNPELKGRIGVSEIAATVVAAWYDWLLCLNCASPCAKLVPTTQLVLCVGTASSIGAQTVASAASLQAAFASTFNPIGRRSQSRGVPAITLLPI